MASMKERGTILRYIKFQLIELSVLVFAIYSIWYFINLPNWLVFAIIALDIIKDIILYFFTWRSYIVPDSNDASLMAGKTCTAAYNFQHTGKVLYNGEIWKAQLTHSGKIKKGDRLKILQIKGLLLIVEAADPEHG